MRSASYFGRWQEVIGSSRADHAFTAVAEYLSLTFGSLQGGSAAVNPAHSGPRLQILLCVWHY